MHHNLIQYVDGITLLRALGRDLREIDDYPIRQNAFLRQIAETVLGRPAALVEACRLGDINTRCPPLAAELCLHALKHAEGEAERTAVLEYASAIGLKVSDSVFKAVASKVYLGAAQRGALERLRAMAQLFFAGPPSGPIVPRLIPLVIGPSGVGKTYLIRALGEELRCPILRLTVGDWQVQGARKQATLERIRDFMMQAPRVLLHLDELDKFRMHSDPWTLAISYSPLELIAHLTEMRADHADLTAEFRQALAQAERAGQQWLSLEALGEQHPETLPLIKSPARAQMHDPAKAELGSLSANALVHALSARDRVREKRRLARDNGARPLVTDPPNENAA